jgi:hypothetical protein
MFSLILKKGPLGGDAGIEKTAKNAQGIGEKGNAGTPNAFRTREGQLQAHTNSNCCLNCLSLFCL